MRRGGHIVRGVDGIVDDHGAGRDGVDGDMFSLDASKGACDSGLEASLKSNSLGAALGDRFERHVVLQRGQAISDDNPIRSIIVPGALRQGHDREGHECGRTVTVALIWTGGGGGTAVGEHPSCCAYGANTSGGQVDAQPVVLMDRNSSQFVG